MAETNADNLLVKKRCSARGRRSLGVHHDTPGREEPESRWQGMVGTSLVYP
jgi:hypothetical protein